MRLFKDPEAAFKSMQAKAPLYLNSYCPYKETALCGNWCALFYYSPAIEDEYKNVSAYVILGCKVDQKRLYVDNLVEADK